jgi:SH3 domain protein
VRNQLILFTLALALGTSALAETRYVSDNLEITMRSGKGNSFSILRMLSSGTPVEVLEVDKDDGYTRVRTSNGKEGWVLTRYLMRTQAARDRLADTQKQLAEMELEKRKLETAMAEMTDSKKALSTQLTTLDSEHRKTSQELAEIKRTASSALALDSENKELKGRVVGLERQLQTLQQENEGLRDRTARDWFMVGAGVILLGIIVGLVIPRIRWRRKSSWDTF